MPRAKPLRSPLPIPDWRSRWLVFHGRGDLLHRVSEIRWWEPDEMIRGDGVTLCGRRGFLVMPGITGRMMRRRCPGCCRRAGVPEGDGAPWNAAKDGEAWKES